MSNRNDLYRKFVSKNVESLDKIIPWPQFDTEKKDYLSKVEPVISAIQGFSRTDFVYFDIDLLISYLSGLKVKGMTIVDVHFVVKTVSEGAYKLDVAFAANGASMTTTLGTSAYDLGGLNP